MKKIILTLLLGILPLNLSAKEKIMDKALVVYFSRTGDQYSVLAE